MDTLIKNTLYPFFYRVTKFSTFLDYFYKLVSFRINCKYIIQSSFQNENVKRFR